MNRFNFGQNRVCSSVDISFVRKCVRHLGFLKKIEIGCICWSGPLFSSSGLYLVEMGFCRSVDIVIWSFWLFNHLEFLEIPEIEYIFGSDPSFARST